MEEGGFSKENLEKVFAIKARRGRIKEYKSDTSKFVEKLQPWKHVEKVDVGMLNIDILAFVFIPHFISYLL